MAWSFEIEDASRLFGLRTENVMRVQFTPAFNAEHRGQANRYAIWKDAPTTTAVSERLALELLTITKQTLSTREVLSPLHVENVDWLDDTLTVEWPLPIEARQTITGWYTLQVWTNNGAWRNFQRVVHWHPDDLPERTERALPVYSVLGPARDIMVAAPPTLSKETLGTLSSDQSFSAKVFVEGRGPWDNVEMNYFRNEMQRVDVMFDVHKPRDIAFDRLFNDITQRVSNDLQALARVALLHLAGREVFSRNALMPYKETTNDRDGYNQVLAAETLLYQMREADALLAKDEQNRQASISVKRGLLQEAQDIITKVQTVQRKYEDGMEALALVAQSGNNNDGGDEASSSSSVDETSSMVRSGMIQQLDQSRDDSLKSLSERWTAVVTEIANVQPAFEIPFETITKDPEEALRTLEDNIGYTYDKDKLQQIEVARRNIATVRSTRLKPRVNDLHLDYERLLETSNDDAKGETVARMTEKVQGNEAEGKEGMKDLLTYMWHDMAIVDSSTYSRTLENNDGSEERLAYLAIANLLDTPDEVKDLVVAPDEMSRAFERFLETDEWPSDIIARLRRRSPDETWLWNKLRTLTDLETAIRYVLPINPNDEDAVIPDYDQQLYDVAIQIRTAIAQLSRSGSYYQMPRLGRNNQVRVPAEYVTPRTRVELADNNGHVHVCYLSQCNNVDGLLEDVEAQRNLAARMSAPLTLRPLNARWVRLDLGDVSVGAYDGNSTASLQALERQLNREMNRPFRALSLSAAVDSLDFDQFDDDEFDDDNEDGIDQFDDDDDDDFDEDNDVAASSSSSSGGEDNGDVEELTGAMGELSLNARFRAVAFENTKPFQGNRIERTLDSTGLYVGVQSEGVEFHGHGYAGLSDVMPSRYPIQGVRFYLWRRGIVDVGDQHTRMGQLVTLDASAYFADERQLAAAYWQPLGDRAGSSYSHLPAYWRPLFRYANDKAGHRYFPGHDRIQLRITSQDDARQWILRSGKTNLRFHINLATPNDDDVSMPAEAVVRGFVSHYGFDGSADDPDEDVREFYFAHSPLYRYARTLDQLCNYYGDRERRFSLVYDDLRYVPGVHQGWAPPYLRFTPSLRLLPDPDRQMVLFDPSAAQWRLFAIPTRSPMTWREQANRIAGALQNQEQMEASVILLKHRNLFDETVYHQPAVKWLSQARAIGVDETGLPFGRRLLREMPVLGVQAPPQLTPEVRGPTVNDSFVLWVNECPEIIDTLASSEGHFVDPADVPLELLLQWLRAWIERYQASDPASLRAQDLQSVWSQMSRQFSHFVAQAANTANRPLVVKRSYVPTLYRDAWRPYLSALPSDRARQLLSSPAPTGDPRDFDAELWRYTVTIRELNEMRDLWLEPTSFHQLVGGEQPGDFSDQEYQTRTARRLFQIRVTRRSDDPQEGALFRTNVQRAFAETQPVPMGVDHIRKVGKALEVDESGTTNPILPSEAQLTQAANVLGSAIMDVFRWDTERAETIWAPGYQVDPGQLLPFQDVSVSVTARESLPSPGVPSFASTTTTPSEAANYAVPSSDMATWLAGLQRDADKAPVLLPMAGLEAASTGGAPTLLPMAGLEAGAQGDGEAEDEEELPPKRSSPGWDDERQRLAVDSFMRDIDNMYNVEGGGGADGAYYLSVRSSQPIEDAELFLRNPETQQQEYEAYFGPEGHFAKILNAGIADYDALESALAEAQAQSEWSKVEELASNDPPSSDDIVLSTEPGRYIANTSEADLTSTFGILGAVHLKQGLYAVEAVLRQREEELKGLLASARTDVQARASEEPGSSTSSVTETQTSEEAAGSSASSSASSSTGELPPEPESVDLRELDWSIEPKYVQDLSDGSQPQTLGQFLGLDTAAPISERYGTPKAPDAGPQTVWLNSARRTKAVGTAKPVFGGNRGVLDALYGQAFLFRDPNVLEKFNPARMELSVGVRGDDETSRACGVCFRRYNTGAASKSKPNIIAVDLQKLDDLMNPQKRSARYLCITFGQLDPDAWLTGVPYPADETAYKTVPSESTVLFLGVDDERIMHVLVIPGLLTSLTSQTTLQNHRPYYRIDPPNMKNWGISNTRRDARMNACPPLLNPYLHVTNAIQASFVLSDDAPDRHMIRVVPPMLAYAGAFRSNTVEIRSFTAIYRAFNDSASLVDAYRNPVAQVGLEEGSQLYPLDDVENVRTDSYVALAALPDTNDAGLLDRLKNTIITWIRTERNLPPVTPLTVHIVPVQEESAGVLERFGLVERPRSVWMINQPTNFITDPRTAPQFPNAYATQDGKGRQNAITNKPEEYIASELRE